MKKTIAEKYKWAKIPKYLSVEDARKLAAKFGKDGLVVVAWEGNNFHIVTVGKNRELADKAAIMGRTIEASLELREMSFGEDRRNEHTD